MNGIRTALCLAVLAGTSCGQFPRDPHGTLERVRNDRSFRVGLVAPLGEGGEPALQAVMHRVGVAAGASAHVESGDAERLLNRLERGDVDLVIGRFEKKSPWAARVTIGPPLRIEKQGDVEIHVAPVMRNGENAWIALIEREARAVAPHLQ